MKKNKILFVGGGSAAVTNIAIDVMLEKKTDGSEIVLYDFNKSAADFNKAFLDKAAKELGSRCRIISTDKSATAFRNADYIIITISTGGLDSMSKDWSIAEEYGIFHTLGDTAGPGGWARRIRNYGTFEDLARKINQYCPNAFVINYTNPMAFTTAVLKEFYTGQVIGLCPGMLENIYAIGQIYKIENIGELSLKYAGLNHFFWITEARYKGIDIIQDFKNRLKNNTLSQLLPLGNGDPMNFKNGRVIADELFRATGIMPYFNDTITSEFFPNYITSKKNLRSCKLKPTTIEQRRKIFANRNESIEKMLQSGILPELLKKSIESAVDVIAAHLSGRQFIGSANLPNTGQITNLPLGMVVETGCVIDRNGANPIHFGKLPEPVATFCHIHSKIAMMTLQGCRQKDRDMLLQAIILEPVCSHLSKHQIYELAGKLLQAHKKYCERLSIF